MANIEKIKLGGTSYDVRDATTLQNLTSAQETTLLNTGTYNGTAVSSGTVFTTDEGKFKEFSTSTPTITTKTDITTSGSSAAFGYFKGIYIQAQSRYTNKVYYSEDNGDSWTETTVSDVSSSNSDYMRKILTNGENLALMFTQYRIASSSDGKNWSLLTSSIPSSSIEEAHFFAGKFYIRRYSTNPLYSSSDGSTWSQVTLPSGITTYYITGTSDKLIIIPRQSGTWYYTQDDGANWTSFTPSGLPSGIAIYEVDSSEILGNKTIMKIQDLNGSGTDWYCTEDGLAYTRSVSSPSSSVSYPDFGYCSGAGLFIALSKDSSSSTKYYTSTDAVNWTEQTRPSTTNAKLVCGPSNFIISRSVNSYPVYFGSLLNLTDLTPTVTVDQTYDSTSANAQSGVAIAGAGFLQNADSTSTNLSIKSSDNTVRLSATGGSVIKSEGYSVSIGYNPSGSTNYATKVGTECYTTQFGIAIGYGASAGGYYSIAIGTVSSPSHHVYASGLYSIAMGYEASASEDYGVCIGPYTQASTSASAFGRSAKATASYAIQIGKGTNSTANTFNVGLSQTDNYTLLESDGTIPIARLGATGGDTGKFLRGDGTWQTVSGGSSKETYTNPALTSVGGVCTWTVTHTLGSRDFVATVYDTTTYKEVMFEGIHTDTTTFTINLTSSSDIASGAYKVVMIG